MSLGTELSIRERALSAFTDGTRTDLRVRTVERLQSPSERLVQLLKEKLEVEYPLHEVVYVKGRPLARFDDLTFTLRDSNFSGLDVDLELMTFRCTKCCGGAGGWYTSLQIIHCAVDVGRVLHRHDGARHSEPTTTKEVAHGEADVPSR